MTTAAISRAIKASEAIKLTDRYALHPAMKPMEPMFKEGRLGAVQSVGVNNTTGSHFECQDMMEHGDTMDGTPARLFTAIRTSLTNGPCFAYSRK